MNQRETSVSLVKKVYNNTFPYLRSTPAYFKPFITLAILELIVLILFYLAPREPLRAIFGPPIKTFWGEQFLHYPLNFVLLPKLVSRSIMILSIIFGSLISGMAVSIILDIYNKRRVQIFNAFKVAIKKYLPLFGILSVINIGYYFIGKLFSVGLAKYFYTGHSKLLFMGPKIWFGLILVVFNFLAALLIQSIFVYSIPALIIDNKGFHKSIGKSVVLFFKFLVPTLILVLLPMLLFIPLIVSSSNYAFLMNKLFPEIVFYLEALGIILSVLIIDPVITMSTTILYLKNKQEG